MPTGRLPLRLRIVWGLRAASKTLAVIGVASVSISGIALIAWPRETLEVGMASARAITVIGTDDDQRNAVAALLDDSWKNIDALEEVADSKRRASAEAEMALKHLRDRLNK